MSDKYLIIIVGPTASGKTALGIEIANYFNTEIISADSRQIYKYLYIGTAQPTYEERAQIKHHLIDFVDITEKYTVKSYENDCIKILSEIFKKKDIALVVGGTGLYINAICNGIDDIPNIKDDVEIEINKIYSTFGIKKCVEELKILDKNCEKNIDLNNTHRVIRALKVIKSTGKPIYTFFKSKRNDRQFKPIFIGLNLKKEILENRIKTRTDNMIKDGLIEEAKNFIKYKDYNSLNTIGYKEIFDYLLNKNQNLENVVNNINIHTRQFAKRQMTWFNKNKEITWITEPNTKKTIDIIERHFI